MRFFMCVASSLFLAAVFLAGCSVTPPSQEAENQGFVVAERFLDNIGAGEMAMAGFKAAQRASVSDNPAMNEVMEEALVNVKEEDFVKLAADVYSKHLDERDLEVLAGFSEKPAIQKYFGAVFGRIKEGRPMSNDILNGFSKAEIEEVMAFTVSDSWVEMVRALPAINAELAIEGERYGREAMKGYLKLKE
ncbi:MAG TPA: hypothetical protein EYG20_03470 [Alcanivorax sp.]|nr:hypothetical protein [Alcanivorax sp.]